MRLAVVDLKGDHPHSILLMNNSIGCKFAHVDRGLLRCKLLVFDADANVERVGPLKVRHQSPGAFRPNHAQRRRTCPEIGLQPAGEPHVRNADGMVGMKMCQQQRIDAADRHAAS